MPITINGTGSITGISAGGLPDGVITADDIASAAVTPAKLSQPFTAGTAVASTSGTSIDFTSIPSWVKRITLIFNGVSTTGSSSYLVRIGGSGGIETTGYVSSAVYTGLASSGTTATAGYIAFFGQGASDTVNSIMTIVNISGNLWIASFAGGLGSQGYASIGAGNKTLSGTLDRVRITTANGTDTFDAGSINILYE